MYQLSNQVKNHPPDLIELLEFEFELVNIECLFWSNFSTFKLSKLKKTHPILVQSLWQSCHSIPQVTNAIQIQTEKVHKKLKPTIRIVTYPYLKYPIRFWLDEYLTNLSILSALHPSCHTLGSSTNLSTTFFFPNLSSSLH